MKIRAVVLGLAALLGATVVVSAGAANPGVGRADLLRLAALPNNESYAIAAFPVSAAHSASVRLKRVEVYAPDAHIYLVTAQGRTELPRSPRIFLRGYSDDGHTRVAMSLNPDGSFAEGSGVGADGEFVLRAVRDKTGSVHLAASPFESALPPGFRFDFRCGNEGIDLGLHGSNDLAGQLRAAVVTAASPTPSAAMHALRLATVAVDTDSLFMSRLFANNTTDATNWIAGMFNTMNTMYERDLLVQLQQGTTFLCGNGCADPYTGATHVPADVFDLDIFANYWKNNHAAINRVFAILLSGQEPSSSSICSPSGIATFGSYSVNQVCTSISIDPNGAFAAKIVGHELGHNFGAWRTHCTDVTTGNA